jgi:malonyl CoA-acyl carrier protein transacylase
MSGEEAAARPPGRHALLFPGQGSQTADMRATVERYRPDLLEAAERIVAPDLYERVGEGTHIDQPAIFCASLAGWKALGRPPAAYMAGHSLGELSALVAAGSIRDEDALELVALRGRLMQECIEQNPGCGMLAVRGGADQARAAAESAGATVANDNAPRQVILSGTAEALERAGAALKEQGVRSKRLPVAGAFHSPLMEPAVAPYAKALEQVEVLPPDCTVLSCATAQPFDDVRAELAAGVAQPVRWRETVMALANAGVTKFVEVGPGKVLSGLVQKTLYDGHVKPVAAEAPAHA